MWFCVVLVKHNDFLFTNSGRSWSIACFNLSSCEQYLVESFGWVAAAYNRLLLSNPTTAWPSSGVIQSLPPSEQPPRASTKIFFNWHYCRQPTFHHQWSSASKMVRFDGVWAAYHKLKFYPLNFFHSVCAAPKHQAFSPSQASVNALKQSTG